MLPTSALSRHAESLARLGGRQEPVNEKTYARLNRSLGVLSIVFRGWQVEGRVGMLGIITRPKLRANRTFEERLWNLLPITPVFWLRL